MILIDTHIWIWWVSDPGRLQRAHSEILNASSASFALSVISCWEAAKLAEYGRLQLPGSFHRDPADQIIVATARVYKIALLTEDTRIVGYPYVQLA